MNHSCKGLANPSFLLLRTYCGMGYDLSILMSLAGTTIPVKFSASLVSIAVRVGELQAEHCHRDVYIYVWLNALLEIFLSPNYSI